MSTDTPKKNHYWSIYLVVFILLSTMAVLRYYSLHSAVYDMGLSINNFYMISEGYWERLFLSHIQPLGFFESLALATEKKKPGVSPRKSKNRKLFRQIRLLALSHNLKARGFLNKLHAGLIDNGHIPEDDPLLDFAIFKKYLTRDKIL